VFSSILAQLFFGDEPRFRPRFHLFRLFRPAAGAPNSSILESRTHHRRTIRSTMYSKIRAVMRNLASPWPAASWRGRATTPAASAAVDAFERRIGHADGVAAVLVVAHGLLDQVVDLAISSGV
jgi:hypothetical protein